VTSRDAELYLHFVVSALGSGPPYPALLICVFDVTNAFRDREHARRAELLAGITQAMTTAPDPDAALQALTDALVPDVADVAAVFVVPAPGAGTRARRGRRAHGDDDQPRGARGGRPAARRRGARPGARPWDSSIAAGRTVLIDLRGRDGKP
jgi:hypothetical protein